jgi:tRNA 2-thiouridine synthesizing protein C
MEKSFIIVLDRSPFGTVWNIEGLRLASALASLDMEVHLLFVNDGVYNTIKNQKPEIIMRSPVTQLINLIKMLSDTAEVLIVRESLQERGLTIEDIYEGFEPKFITMKSVADHISNAYTAITV